MSVCVLGGMKHCQKSQRDERYMANRANILLSQHQQRTLESQAGAYYGSLLGNNAGCERVQG